MTTTRADYELIAGAFRTLRRNSPYNYVVAESLNHTVQNIQREAFETTIGLTIAALCDVFEHQNPRFDRKRFIEACEVEHT